LIVAHVDSTTPLGSFLKALGPRVAKDYLKSLRSYKQLDVAQKQVAKAFLPPGGFGYGRSYAFQDAAPQGSIFKVIPGYAALVETYRKHPTNDISVLNPLTIIDDARRVEKGWVVGRTMQGEPIPQFYKGGRLPRSSAPNMGQVDLMHAIEISSNPYFSLLAVDVLKSPSDLARAARLFSYGKRTGFDLAGELPGFVPTDLETNRAGLYACTMGQHTLLATPLQAAVAMAALSNGGHVLKPQIVRRVCGRDRTWNLSTQERQFAYWRPLSLIGVDFPLFSAATCDSAHIHTTAYGPEVRWDLLMPDPVRTMLLEGLRRVIQGERGPAQPSRIRSLDQERRLVQDYIEMQSFMVGKSSSAEKGEVVGLSSPEIYKHIWFAAISFDDCSPLHFGRPDLVVVVYLKYGDFGKEAAPLAAAVIKKWHQIRDKHVVVAK
jgi:cell division protein FtsI/penicillin-binding protein 2